QKQALAARFAQQKSLYAQLNSAQQQEQSLLKRYQNKLSAQVKRRAARIAAAQAAPTTPTTSGGGTAVGHPFQTCRVRGPHAYSDSFAAPRYTTVPPHPHPGHDIMQPMGTTIAAP